MWASAVRVYHGGKFSVGHHILQSPSDICRPIYFILFVIMQCAVARRHISSSFVSYLVIIKDPTCRYTPFIEQVFINAFVSSPSWPASPCQLCSSLFKHCRRLRISFTHRPFPEVGARSSHDDPRIKSIHQPQQERPQSFSMEFSKLICLPPKERRRCAHCSVRCVGRSRL